MMQLQCAVIGCGRIGCSFDDGSNGKIIRTHAGSYFKNPTTNLVALCDIDESKLRKYGHKYGIKGLYRKSSEMFKKEKIDCVSICTFADSHLELVKESARNGVKGIFLEKPMSNTLKNAQEIIDICKKKEIHLLIDHKRRFDPFYESIQKIIQREELGHIQLVNVYYGAGISNTGSHLFDLLRFFFGEIVSLQGNFSKNISANPDDPNIDLVLEMTNNIACKIHALDYKPYAIFEMDILGTSGRTRLNLISNQVEYFKIPHDEYFVYKDLVRSKINVKNSNLSPLPLGIKNLVNSIQGREKPKCTGDDGYKSLELIIASIQSAKLRRKIDLPLTKNNYKINSK